MSLDTPLHGSLLLVPCPSAYRFRTPVTTSSTSVTPISWRVQREGSRRPLLKRWPEGQLNLGRMDSLNVERWGTLLRRFTTLSKQLSSTLAITTAL